MKFRNILFINIFVLLSAFAIGVKIMEKNSLLIPENDIKKTVDAIVLESSKQVNRVTKLVSQNTIKTKESQGNLLIPILKSNI
jgi:hypothetical protein